MTDTQLSKWGPRGWKDIITLQYYEKKLSKTYLYDEVCTPTSFCSLSTSRIAASLLTFDSTCYMQHRNATIINKIHFVLALFYFRTYRKVIIVYEMYGRLRSSIKLCKKRRKRNLNFGTAILCSPNLVSTCTICPEH